MPYSNILATGVRGINKLYLVISHPTFRFESGCFDLGFRFGLWAWEFELGFGFASSLWVLDLGFGFWVWIWVWVWVWVWVVGWFG